MRRVNRPTIIPTEVEATIERLINETVWGSLTVVIQDGRIIQLDRHEKYQFGKKPIMPNVTVNQAATGGKSNPLRQVHTALTGIQFGQLVLKIQDGRIVQIDRTEKQRLAELTGTSGDGI